MSQKKRLSSSSGIAPAMISATKKPKPQQAGGGGGGIEAYEKMGIRELVNEEETVAGELMVLEHQGVDPTVPTPCAVPGGAPLPTFPGRRPHRHTLPRNLSSSPSKRSQSSHLTLRTLHGLRSRKLSLLSTKSNQSVVAWRSFIGQLKICACTKWLATYIAGFSKNVRSILRPSCNC